MPKAVRRLRLEPGKGPTLKARIQEFIAFKEAQGMAERTIDDYYNHLGKFVSFSGNSMDLKHLETTGLRYLAQFSHLKPVTYNIQYKLLNCLFNWFVSKNYLPSNPLKNQGLKKRKEDRDKIRHHDPETIEKLLVVMDLTTYTGLRDYALTLLTLDTGIRPSEAFGLRIGDFDYRGNKIKVRDSIAKTRVSRELFISTPVAEVLSKLISYKFKHFDDYIFISTDGRPMNRNSWKDRLDGYCEKAKCNHVAPYDLRHTFAVMYIKNGGDVFSLAKIMGHADISMTEVYVRLSKEDVKEQHSYASPVNRFVQRSSRMKRLLK